jgi:hypothetical protein
MDPVAHATHDFPLDRVGLAADPRREVPPPAVVEARHLGEARGLAVGDPVADPGLQLSREVFEHTSIMGSARGWVKRTPLAENHPRNSAARFQGTAESRHVDGAVPTNTATAQDQGATMVRREAIEGDGFGGAGGSSASGASPAPGSMPNDLLR